ncbi:NAD(P)/FAD-dependent oxidoreductase [Maribacter algicola]|uniref:NAD(P)/FAD-dependent oxidoreductase n=1 Tax=Meishania litoralis TaxID=3434685 RepID=A0ACC7LIV6_9FLAO
MKQITDLKEVKDNLPIKTENMSGAIADLNQNDNPGKNTRVAIIGGGLMGMALAHRVSELNTTVKVFESGSQLGGLSTHHDYGDFSWDKFYHVIVPTDGSLINLIKDIGLEEKLRWSRSYTGYYVDKKFHSLNSPKEFLLFPLLNIWDKVRLVFTIFYGGRINDWKKLERTTVKDWLIKMGGKKNFTKFWEPLLLAKLGENYKRVSAVFIWTYIRRLFKAREHPVEKDYMGYVSGGYKTVFDRLKDLLAKKGSSVMLNTSVESIVLLADGGLEVRYNDKIEHFDKVIFTAPINILEKVTSPTLFEIKKTDKSIEYLGVVCLALVTRKPLTPFYVLNMGDVNTPFTGVIGISSLVDQEETAGNYITYFPKYIPSDHEYWDMSDEAIREIFMSGVRNLYPDLVDDDIVSTHINRAYKVQPLQVLNYSGIIPKIKTKHPDFFILNTSQFVNDSVNNNRVVQHVDGFMEQVAKELEKGPITNLR